MNDAFIEARHPISFRKKDAQTLGEHIRLRHSVELVGIKRVGISNFLRFFLYHPDIVSTYINHGEHHLFIPVDLNDLIEREIYPFWILTFKRIVDAAEKSDLNPEVKSSISTLFLESIQSQDHFLTIENIRTALLHIVNGGVLPTLFLIRFDRLQDAATPEFFGNLQGLIDATGQKLSYVFTSFRPLDQISPVVFPRKSLSGFTHLMYLAPADKKDMKTILSTLEKRYNFHPTSEIEMKLLDLAGGHVQYLHLALVILNENKEKKGSSFVSLIENDERMMLQSEEIWESLYKEEQAALLKVLQNKKLSQNEKEEAKYLWLSGIFTEENTLFSPLFTQFVDTQATEPEDATIELSKKEHTLFTLLEENINSICDRDSIIERVWPESEDAGVSDWTIDRLVARLRSKLKIQNSSYAIITVKTRGYKLVKE